MKMKIQENILNQLTEAVQRRVLVIDGAMGTMIQRHRLIYAALADLMRREIHALSIGKAHIRFLHGHVGLRDHALFFSTKGINVLHRRTHRWPHRWTRTQRQLPCRP